MAAPHVENTIKYRLQIAGKFTKNRAFCLREIIIESKKLSLVD
jgi:hypothetical protein